MKHRGIIAAIVVFVLIILGMFVFAFLKKSEIAEAPAAVPYVETPQTTPYDTITRVDAKHFYIDGTHTIAGEILMPTPCDLLNWDSVVRESMPESVLVDFTVLNNSDTCAALVTPQRFLVTFKASENARIDATLNGRPIELNLIPALKGETPDDFELYIKG